MAALTSFPKIEKDTIFQKNWETYQVVLRENYNQEANLYGQVSDYLATRFSESFSVLDLGCGDVNYFSKALLKNNLWSRVLSYTGVDLSAPAAEIGEQNVRQAASPNTQVSFVLDDMLSFVKKVPPCSFDFVLSSLAIHHLQDTDKEHLVREIGRVLKPNGVLMVIDIFLEEDEDRDKFVRDFAHHIRYDWIKLSNEQNESIVNHMSNFDFPAKLSAYKSWATLDSYYKDVKCLENMRFYKTIVLEA